MIMIYTVIYITDTELQEITSTLKTPGNLERGFDMVQEFARSHELPILEEGRYSLSFAGEFIQPSGFVSQSRDRE
jgi:hypothetical protein